MSVTLGLLTAAGTRIGSVHIHLDGTFKFFASRAGRQGGYAANIVKAGIEGFIAEVDEEGTTSAGSASQEVK